MKITRTGGMRRMAKRRVIAKLEYYQRVIARRPGIKDMALEIFTDEISIGAAPANLWTELRAVRAAAGPKFWAKEPT